MPIFQYRYGNGLLKLGRDLGSSIETSRLRFFFERLTADSSGPLPVTLEDARRSLELIIALCHAAATGGPVALPIGADHPRYRVWH